MQFCEECGSMMKSAGDEMVCSNCGHVETKDEERAAEFVSTEEQDTSDVIESLAADAFEGKPTAEVTCEECGNVGAWYTIKQTGSADEPPTRFFKCKECGARWREYA